MICRKAFLAAALVGLAALCGCRHPMADYERSLVAGDYPKAVSIATDEIKDGDKDELMWRLMAGGASHLAGDGTTAIAHFDRAEDVMIDHDGTSAVSKGATGTWAMLTNDKAFPYDGGGQDRVMTCLYKAIDFAAEGKPDAARTELNRAAQHQENWLTERRKEITDAQERLEKDAAAYKKSKEAETAAAPSDKTVDSGKVVDGAFSNADFIANVKRESGFDMATDGVLDKLTLQDWMNPYAAHVTGVFRWLNGDECRNYLKDAATYSKQNPTARRDFADVEKGAKPKDQVWIWLEEGLGPKREEWRIDLPLILIPYLNRFVMYAGMALPKLVERPAAGTDWRVGNTPMSEIVDMNAKLKLEFDVYFRAALIREITRTSVKIGSQVALGVVAENINDRYTQIALKASQAAVAAWAASTTGADVRSWTTLPKKVHVARLDRPTDGKIVLSGSGGNLAEITVQPGNSMIFVSKPSPQATAAVKVITYP